jgi:hypothetical protein
MAKAAVPEVTFEDVFSILNDSARDVIGEEIDIAAVGGAFNILISIALRCHRNNPSVTAAEVVSFYREVGIDVDGIPDLKRIVSDVLSAAKDGGKAKPKKVASKAKSKAKPKR